MEPAADCKTEHMGGAKRPGRLGRLVRPTDFERLLKSPSCARSSRFALHHVAGTPSKPAPTHRTRPSKLSTDLPQVGPSLVDNPAPLAAAAAPIANGDSPAGICGAATRRDGDGATHWLGFVLPKRWARRAVTRNLVRRLARASFAARLLETIGSGAGSTTGGLPPGLWALRLKSAIDAQRFHSASSPLLRASLHEELQSLWQRAARQAPSSRSDNASRETAP